MTADQQRALGVAQQREPLVAGRVDRLLGRGAGELAPEPFAGALPRLGPGDSLGAILVARQILELTKVGDRAAGIEHARDRKRLRGVW